MQPEPSEHLSPSPIPFSGGEPDDNDAVSLAPDMELGEDGELIVKRKRAESSATEASPPKGGSSCKSRRLSYPSPD
jgi:hypothetical protein